MLQKQLKDLGYLNGLKFLEYLHEMCFTCYEFLTCSTLIYYQSITPEKSFTAIIDFILYFCCVNVDYVQTLVTMFQCFVNCSFAFPHSIFILSVGNSIYYGMLINAKWNNHVSCFIVLLSLTRSNPITFLYV